MAMSPLHPNHMTDDERLAEIAEILARGLVRLHARKSSPLSADCGDSSSTYRPTEAVMPRPQTENGMTEQDTVLARSRR